MIPRIIGGALIWIASAAAAPILDIPASFVTNQAQLIDPVLGSNPASALAVSGFGGGDIQGIGDINGDGYEEYVVGAKKSFQDSGSIVLLSLNPDGSTKSSTVYTTKDPAFSGYLGTKTENFGEGIAVFSKASKSDPCSRLVVSATSRGKLYGITLCREAGSTPKLTVSSMIDTATPALSGLWYQTLRIGASMAVIDTIAKTGEQVVALGVPDATRLKGAASVYYAGSVVLLAVNSGATWSWRRLSVLPNSLESSDPLFQQVYGNSGFGTSVVCLGGGAKGKGIAILAPGDTVNTSPLGRIHLLTLDGQWQAATHSTLPGTTNLATTGAAKSLAVADFNHDGVSDLVFGYSLAVGPNGELKVGGYSVNLLDANWNIAASKYFAPGLNGISNTVPMPSNGRLGTKVAAVDFDGDGQIDVLAGAEGLRGDALTTLVPGAVWAFRHKARAWRHMAADTIRLSNKTTMRTTLTNYLTGNHLAWTYSPLNPPPAGSSLAECSLIDDTLKCWDKGVNGIAFARVVGMDDGNIPSTDHFYDTLDFVLKVTGADSAPVMLVDPPTISLPEDQRDTSVLVLSKFYADPEKTQLTFTLKATSATSKPLLDTFYMHQDTLHLKLVPLRFGLCSLQVTVKDKAGSFLTDTLVVSVRHVNHAPVAKNDSIQAIEATPLSIPVMVNDVDADGDPLSIVVSPDPVYPRHGHAVVDPKIVQNVLFTPDSFFIGTDSVKYELKDAQSSSFAWVKISINKGSVPPRVVRPLPKDYTIAECRKDSIPIIAISYDSLFYWGTDGFDVPVVEPPVASLCGPIAAVKLDTKTKHLVITPIPYKSGECQIIVYQNATKDSVASAMMLHITPVPSPYHFASDTVHVGVPRGERTLYVLDSIDLDQDTIEYFLLDQTPAWVVLEQNRLSFTPDKKSFDAAYSIATRKKAKPGAALNPATDTLVMIVELSTASIHGRKIGGLQMQYERGSRLLSFQGGETPYLVEVVRPNGMKICQLQGQAGQVASAQIPGTPGPVFLRVLEGNRRYSSSILLNP